MEMLPESDAGHRRQSVLAKLRAETAKLPDSADRSPHGGMGEDTADTAVTPGQEQQATPDDAA